MSEAVCFIAGLIQGIVVMLIWIKAKVTVNNHTTTVLCKGCANPAPSNVVVPRTL